MAVYCDVCTQPGRHRPVLGCSARDRWPYIDQDWEPLDTCVADMANYLASSIDDPAAIGSLDADSVAEYFSELGNSTQQP